VKKIKKKILIIGGTGFIGSHLIKKTLKLGWGVTSISLKKNKNNQNKKAKYINLDFSDFNSLKKKVNFDFDYIINLGGYINHSNKKIDETKILKNHFESTINLILLSNHKLKRYIHIGTSDEYGNSKSPIKENSNELPMSAYANAKNLSTNLLLKLNSISNFPVTILRLFIVYGPNQKQDRLLPYVITQSLKHRKIYLSHGRQLRDFCYVDDIIDAIIICLKNKKSVGQIFNLGSGIPISVKKIVNKVIKFVGSGEPKYNYFIGKNNENLKLYPSITKAKKILGWKPKISIEDGLKKTINSYKRYIK
tara:strand:+ start:33 stop:953 length:921 start_codon:yes stop_codon:yes gene_type:complete